MDREFWETGYPVSGLYILFLKKKKIKTLNLLWAFGNPVFILAGRHLLLLHCCNHLLLETDSHLLQSYCRHLAYSSPFTLRRRQESRPLPFFFFTVFNWVSFFQFITVLLLLKIFFRFDALFSLLHIVINR